MYYLILLLIIILLICICVEFLIYFIILFCGVCILRFKKIVVLRLEMEIGKKYGFLDD